MKLSIKTQFFFNVKALLFDLSKLKFCIRFIKNIIIIISYRKVFIIALFSEIIRWFWKRGIHSFFI